MRDHTIQGGASSIRPATETTEENNVNREQEDNNGKVENE